VNERKVGEKRQRLEEKSKYLKNLRIRLKMQGKKFLNYLILYKEEKGEF